jgi:hypothetical protein
MCIEIGRINPTVYELLLRLRIDAPGLLFSAHFVISALNVVQSV